MIISEVKVSGQQTDLRGFRSILLVAMTGELPSYGNLTSSLQVGWWDCYIYVKALRLDHARFSGYHLVKALQTHPFNYLHLVFGCGCSFIWLIFPLPSIVTPISSVFQHLCVRSMRFVNIWETSNVFKQQCPSSKPTKQHPAPQLTLTCTKTAPISRRLKNFNGSVRNVTSATPISFAIHALQQKYSFRSLPPKTTKTQRFTFRPGALWVES